MESLEMSAWADHGGVSDVFRHRLLIHDGYLSTEALSVALATCKSWARLAPPGVTFAAAINDALLGRRADLPRVMHDLPADVRRHIATAIAPNALMLIPVVKGYPQALTVVSVGDRVLDDDERDIAHIVPPGVLLALSRVAGMCKDFEVSDVPAETAEALRGIANRLVDVHFFVNYDTCKEVVLGIGNRNAADICIMLTLGDLARHSAHSAGALFDVVYRWLDPGGGTFPRRALDDDDNALLARIAPWVPVDQLEDILAIVFGNSIFDGGDGLETLAERAGEAFAHRADEVLPVMAARIIEEARQATPLVRGPLWTSKDLVRHLVIAMGRTAAKASARLFLPFVDDAATRPHALQVLMWILCGNQYLHGRQYKTFFAKEPIVTLDEFQRVASHLGAANDLEGVEVLRVMTCFARADTLGDGDGVLREAVASITPRIMDLIRNGVTASRGDFCPHYLFLAEGAIAGVAGVAELLASSVAQSDLTEYRTPWAEAVERVAEGTTAADDVLVEALRERLLRRTAADRNEWQNMDDELKAIAAFGARAARIAPQLVTVLAQAEAEDEDNEFEHHGEVLAALVALGADVYRQQAISVAEWARAYIERMLEYRPECQIDMIEEDIIAPARQIIQLLGVEAAPYARELVVLLRYQHSDWLRERGDLRPELFVLPEECLLSRCRTLRLVAEFGDRCPEAGVSALLDQVLQWDGSDTLAGVGDGRLDAHVFSTLLRLGRDRLAPHAGRILSNLTNPPINEFNGYRNVMHEFPVGAVELVAALLPNATARAFLVTLLNDKIRGMARPDDGQEFDERSIAYAAATALRAANCAVNDETSGRIARILAEDPPHEDWRLEGHCVADVEAACAAELGLLVS